MEELIGSVDVARMLGVTRQRVVELADTYEDFPSPQKVGGRLVFPRRGVERWIAAHPDRRPGPRGPRKKVAK